MGDAVVKALQKLGVVNFTSPESPLKWETRKEFVIHAALTGTEDKILRDVQVTTLAGTAEYSLLKENIAPEIERLIYLIPEGSRITLNIFYLQNRQANQTVDFLVEDGAELTLNEFGYYAGEVRYFKNLYLGKNARCHLQALILSNQPYKNVTTAYLAEPESFFGQRTVILNNTDHPQIVQSGAHHLAPFCESNLDTYGIASGAAELAFLNVGYIKKGAMKTIINQHITGIILSEAAQIEGNPVLYIDENDVVANHGTAIGSIDDDQLYYLMSRGLSLEESRKLVMMGYMNPFLAALGSEPIGKVIVNLLEKIV